MALKTVRLISLLSTALLAGLLFCHALELPNKMKLGAATWLTVQQVLYNLFGPVAGVIEPVAIASTLALLVMVRGRRAVFALTLLASLCLVVHLGEWFAVVDPVNREVNGWTETTMPADWMRARDRWEYGHAAGAVLALVALVALILAALADTPRAQGRQS
jgi:hypothetical protein